MASRDQEKGKKRAYRSYPSKRCTLASVPVSREELAWLRKLKGKLGFSWREAIYRGLGARREDFLASRKSAE